MDYNFFCVWFEFINWFKTNWTSFWVLRTSVHGLCFALCYSRHSVLMTPLTNQRSVLKRAQLSNDVIGPKQEPMRARLSQMLKSEFWSERLRLRLEKDGPFNPLGVKSSVGSVCQTLGCYCQQWWQTASSVENGCFPSHVKENSHFPHCWLFVITPDWSPLVIDKQSQHCNEKIPKWEDLKRTFCSSRRPETFWLEFRFELMK